MDLPVYEVEFSSIDQYDFLSVGKNGTIEKSIIFTPMAVKGFYNLLLCDVLENGEISDLAISDNGDTEKILATVAQCVFYFTDFNPTAFIYAKGSTLSRTRLYRMGLNKHYDSVVLKFDIFGFKDNNWHQFEKNTNYEAFLVQKK